LEYTHLKITLEVYLLITLSLLVVAVEVMVLAVAVEQVDTAHLLVVLF
jgi:hypothetical protein